MSLSFTGSQVSFNATVNGRPVQPLRLVLAAAAMACLGFTIFYWAAAPFFSGERIENLELQTSSSLQLPGITFSRSGPRQETVGPVALDPTMNRVGLVLHVGHGHLSPTDRLSCDITARDEAGRVVWQDDHVIMSGRIGRQAAVGGAESHLVTLFGTMEVPQSDQYTFEVRFASSSLDVVRAATLELRRNVSGASKAVVAFGAAMAVACVIGFIAIGRGDGDETDAMPKAA